MLCFSIQNASQGEISNHRRLRRVCFMLGLWPDHARVMVGLWLNHLSIGGGIWRFFWFQIVDFYCWCVLHGEPNEFVTFCWYSQMHVWWQVQYLVNFSFCKCTESWQGQWLVRYGDVRAILLRCSLESCSFFGHFPYCVLRVNFVAGAIFGRHECRS